MNRETMKTLEQILSGVLDDIRADSRACERDAAQYAEKGDKLNAYLMQTQAMAHQLDIARIEKAFRENS